MNLDRLTAKQRLKQALIRFHENQYGGLSLQTALVFAAFGLMLAIFGAPLIQTASMQYADNRIPGVDRMTTSSIGNGGGGRYTIRKSVLSEEPQILCGSKITAACIPDRR